MARALGVGTNAAPVAAYDGGRDREAKAGCVVLLGVGPEEVARVLSTEAHAVICDGKAKPFAWPFFPAGASGHGSSRGVAALERNGGKRNGGWAVAP